MGEQGAHWGIPQGIARLCTGAACQRWRVHFASRVLDRVPRSDKSMSVETNPAAFAQPNQGAALQQLVKAVRAMELRWPRVAQVLGRGENEVLTYMPFPRSIEAASGHQRMEAGREPRAVG